MTPESISDTQIVGYLEQIFANKVHANDTKFMAAVRGAVVYHTLGGYEIVVVGPDSKEFAPRGAAFILSELWNFYGAHPKFYNVKIGGKEGFVFDPQALELVRHGHFVGVAGDVRYLAEFANQAISDCIKTIRDGYKEENLSAILARLQKVGENEYSYWTRLDPEKKDEKFVEIGLQAYVIAETARLIGDPVYNPFYFGLREAVVRPLRKTKDMLNSGFITRAADSKEKGVAKTPTMDNAVAKLRKSGISVVSTTIIDATPLVDSLCAPDSVVGVYDGAMSRFLKGIPSANLQAIILTEITRQLLIRELVNKMKVKA